MRMSSSKYEPLMLYDGECALCEGSVIFVLKYEYKPSLNFAPMQSELGRSLLKANGMDPDRLSSFVIVQNGKANIKHDASRLLMYHLGGIFLLPWALTFLVPKFVGDRIYSFFFDRRKLWFGSTEICLPKNPEWQKRFIDFPST